MDADVQERPVGILNNAHCGIPGELERSCRTGAISLLIASSTNAIHADHIEAAATVAKNAELPTDVEFLNRAYGRRHQLVSYSAC